LGERHFCPKVIYKNLTPDRQWRSSSFQESKKVRISRDLWPWPWPWAHPGCTLTWSPSCESLVAIRPFSCEKKRFALKFTDGQTDRRRSPRHCISSFLEWAKMRVFYVTFAGKIIKMPGFLWYLSEKLTKFPNFTWYLPERYFPDFFFGGGGTCPLFPPVSYAYEKKSYEILFIFW